MKQHCKPAVMMLLLLTLLTGGIYPAVVTVLAQLLFPEQANGNSADLIGQPFSSPRYFWGRPSATLPFPYNAKASHGSNLTMTNSVLIDTVKTRIQRLKAADPDNKMPIPVDLITASASGLDPHISPAAANYQILRVAKARGISPEIVQILVVEYTEPRQWGLLGEPRVNVLKLNLALDNEH